MNIWKKAVTSLTAAALLASLTASAAFAAKGAAGESDQTDWLTCSVAAVHTTATCAQVADGISSVTLIGDVDGLTSASDGSLYITATNASIIGVAGGKFTLAGGIVTTGLLGATSGLAVTDTITLRAPSAAATTVVSVYLIDGGTGIAGTPETLTITWTATSGLGVSVANSVVQTNVAASDCSVVANAFDDTKLSNAAASPTATTVAELCVLVRDGNGSTVANGTSVAATITPVGLLGPGAVFGQTSTSTTTAGVAQFHVRTTGLAGVAAIGVSVTLGSVTTSFAPVTFTFTGALASITLANASSVGGVGLTVDKAITFIAKDASGNRLPLAFGALTATYSSGAPFTIVADTDTSATVTGKLDAVCGPTAGTGTVTVTSSSITSNAVTFNCSNAAASFTAAFDKTTVAPGGTATLTVTAVDDGGRPAPDTTTVSVVVSSGAFVPVVVTTNGVATITYLAPFNTGVATASVGVDSLTRQNASINVSSPVPVTAATAATALGITTSGPFTTETKIQSVGKYVTYKFDFGTAAAGRAIKIWSATKSGTTWSAFTVLTTGVADSSGVVYYKVRQLSATWKSYRAQDETGGTYTPARQARWV